MGLGVPLALLGLLAVAVPLWLHRVRRKSLRDVTLPTVGLLRRAVVQKRRTLSFLDRPLLYARLALAALCALALARPYLSQLTSYASERPLALAVVLDDSMSMHQPATRGGTLFELARRRASRVLSELAPDSEASVVLAGSAPRVLAARTSDLETLGERLSGVEHTGARGTSLKRALDLATRELTTSRLSMKEVLVLTDCAAHAGADELRSPGAHVRVECMEPNSVNANAYIRAMRLAGSADVSAPSTLHLAVESGAKHAELDVSLHIDGRRLTTHKVLMNDGLGSAEITVDAQALRGARVLSARIETRNAIAEDDVRDLLLDDHTELTVLLVDGDPAPNQLDDELRYAALALSVDDGERAPPKVTRIDAEGLTGADFSPYDVVVLANVRAPSVEVAESLAMYVSRGGGLLITAGENVDAFAYRGSMAALLPAIVRSHAPAEPALALSEGPALESPLVPEQGKGMQTAGTRKRLLLEPPTPPNETLLTFADGSPLLVAGQYQGGTVALLTTTLDDDWTDIPLTPGFLPLITGLVRGLAAMDGLPPGPHAAGTTLSTRVPPGASAVYLVTPDGRRVDLPVRDTLVTIRDTAVTGVYRAFAKLDGRREQELEQLSFLVVADLADSDLALRLPKPEPAPNALGSAARARGIEGWFWLAFGLLAILEGALRVLNKRGAQPAAA